MALYLILNSGKTNNNNGGTRRRVGKRNTITDQPLGFLPCVLLHVLAIALSILLWDLHPQPYSSVILETSALSSGKTPYAAAHVLGEY